MNLTKLKTYAPAARNALITAVTRRAGTLGIQPGRVEEVTESGNVALIGGQPFPRSIVPLRKQLLDLIHRDGFDHTMEAMAYTWFNRLVALRFMELHDGYLDHGYRVLSHPQGTPLPEILQHAEHVSLKGLDREEVIRLKLDGNRDEELYRLLLLAQCAELNRILPDVFSRLDDATILLLPDNLLHSDSVIRQLIASSNAEDWQQVEVLGWLYQFYISERKDQVMARKSAVPTEDIPAVTQLFTPHWIVRYLVENSLGRLWMDSRPNSKLVDHMPYYIRPDASGDRDQGLGVREESSYEHTKLQRPDCVAESHGLSGGNPSPEQNLSTGGALRADQPDSAGSGVGAVQHRGGTREAINSGIQELSFDLPGIAGGSGHPAASGPALRVSHSRASHESHPTDGGNRQNAALFASQAREVGDRGQGKLGGRGQGIGVSGDSDSLSLPPNPSSLTPSPLRVNKPEEIRLVDPAVGSGHMLTYAFDLLVLIYEEEGYAANDIPGLILKHNLHGLEICPRAAQLAELALVFKAREKSRRFFQPEHFVRPRIIELCDVRFAENELRDYIRALGLGDLFNQPMLRLLHQFEEAKNFGSLIQPCLDERAIADVRRAIEAKDLGGQLFLRETHLKVLRVLEQAEALNQRYHVAVANPPYMGGGNMNETLKQYAENHYADSQADLFSLFIARCVEILLDRGQLGMITMQSWMFLSRYSSFRTNRILTNRLCSCVHIGYNTFPELNSKVAQGVAFVLETGAPSDREALFFNLNSAAQSANKDQVFQELLRNESAIKVDPSSFSTIPESPLIYWFSASIIALYKTVPLLRDHASIKSGLSTGENEKFLREWFEISVSRFNTSCSSSSSGSDSSPWVPYNKGGAYRKWFGNNSLVLDWGQAGERLRDYGRAVFRNKDNYFSSGITWSGLTSSRASFRSVGPGFVFDSNKGAMLFAPAESQSTILGFLNSEVANHLLAGLNPTLSTQVGDIERLPVVSNERAEVIVAELVTASKADWDNFETSWDFRDQPLLRPGLKGATLEASWRNWEAQSTAAIRRMQELETENNRLFIAAYGLDGELQPEVPEAQITLARAEARRDMAAFLSYAVGCMMGRYSPDHPGLILANAGDTLREFLEKVGKPLAELTFAPDEDGIIPVLDGEWFEDDIVARIKEFLRVTFSEATLVGNIAFIEDALGKDLRTYFLNDFYKDHLQTYKNRPIYWQLSSGKQKAFQCLIYLHRYTPATLARIRTEYAIPLQGKLSARITRLEEDVIQTASSAARKKLQTDLDKCKKQIVELLAFDEQLRSYADQAITLDLDDGVKTNYAKFGILVAESKKICGTKED